MQINLIKQSNGSFIPAYPSDHDSSKKFKVGEECNFVYKKIRNPKFHRKYFAMVRMLFDNQDTTTNQRAFRKLLEVKAGYYDAIITDSGTFFCPKSIAYDKLGKEGFEDLYNSVSKVAFEKFAMDNKDIERHLIDFM